MSNDLNSSGEKPVKRRDPRVLSLRRRLGSLPEIVQQYGLPPSDESDSPVIGRSRSQSEPPPVPPRTVSKSPQDVPQDVPVESPEAVERRSKRETLTTKMKLFEKSVPFYTKRVGDEADPKHGLALTDAKRRVDECDKLVDDQAAITEIEAITQIATNTMAAMNEHAQQIETRKKLSDALQNFETTLKPPEYGGKSPFKSTGKKEFERDVTNPVAALLKRIEGPIKAGRMISEEDHNELHRLKGVVARKSEDYSDKADTVDAIKNPHTHKLYKDYEDSCDKLLEQLKTFETAAVPPEVNLFRTKKREVDAAFKELDKRVDVWKRIDSNAHGLYQDVAERKREEYRRIQEQFDKDGDLTAASGSLDALLKNLKQTKDGVFGSPESNQKLNEQVAKLGKAPKKKEDVEFLKEALKARYNLDRVDGDLSGTCLVAFYNTFAKVPDSHAKQNKWLTDLERARSLEDVSSFYKAVEKDQAPKKEGLVAIKAMRSSGPLTMVQNGLVSEKLLKNVEGSKKVDQFSWVTLHEIGHAVDHSDDFMKRRRAEFGDWKEHSESFIEKMMLDAFCSEHPKAPKKFAVEYLKAVRAGKDPAAIVDLTNKWSASAKLLAAIPGENTAAKQRTLLATGPLLKAEELRLKYEAEGWPDLKGVTDAVNLCINAKPRAPKEFASEADLAAADVLNLKTPAGDVVRELIESCGDPGSGQPNWEALKKSDILVWYKNAVLKEPAGVLEGIKQMTGSANWIRAGEVPRPDGRVYQEAYKGKWISYQKEARDGRVTDYQMRAEGEYFAEAYAAYFLGKLPKSAPLYNALVELEQKQELAN